MKGKALHFLVWHKGTTISYSQKRIHYHVSLKIIWKPASFFVPSNLCFKSYVTIYHIFLFRVPSRSQKLQFRWANRLCSNDGIILWIKDKKHPAQVETICGIVCVNSELWKKQVSIVHFCFLVHEKYKKRTVTCQQHFHQKRWTSMRKFLLIQKARKKGKIIWNYLNENLRWRRKSFVHCHLMECNSRWNKTYDIQKRANIMKKNLPRFISQIK